MLERTVQQYRLLERIGAGGMGEIYKARDTQLNRFVAMKVLPADMSADPDRRRRFLQEAQAASALNHPNIITIYDIVHDGETQYLVVEYLAGKTLLELIPKDGLPVPQVIRYASQMAEALSAAHAARIIHRDIKPANVMVNTSGLIKVLDFGLAKFDWSPADAGAETTTVLQPPLTIEGTLMGTVNYMSPEQAEGRKLDTRSDIFSFGSVLYEMLTGRFAFRGNSVISTLSAVLRDEIQPIAELKPGVPPELERILEGCLKKKPEERFQSMQGILVALNQLKSQSDSGALSHPITTGVTVPPAYVRRGMTKALVVGVALVMTVAVVVGGGYWWRTAHRSEPAVSPSLQGAITDDSVLEMVRAGVAPSVVVSQIRASRTNFNLSSSEVIRLSKAGVPAAVIEVMRNPQQKPTPVETPVANPTAPAPVPAMNVPPAKAPPDTATVVLGDGLAIRLILAEDIKIDAAEGDALQFRTSDDVRVNDIVVFPKGTMAIGAIVDGAKKRVLGIGGKMTFRLEGVYSLDGREVPIRATQARRRDGSSTRPLDTGAKTRKEVAAAAGTEYVGYIDGSNTLSVKK